MCNTWELDGGLLAKIDEYFQSHMSSPREGWNDSAERSCSLGRHKRTRIIDSPNDCVESSESDDSEASGDEGEYQPECVVCNEIFNTDSEIGVPMTCIHIFCYMCIKEWSNRTNVCPICKSEFNVMRRLRWQQFTDFLSAGRTNVNSKKQAVEAKIKSYKTMKRNLIKCLAAIPSQIETVYHKSLAEETEDPIGGCEVCGADSDWEALLLCDGCNLGYHIFCLDPPLDSVPQGDWFCKACLEAQGMRHEESERTINVRDTIEPCNRTGISSSRRRNDPPRHGTTITSGNTPVECVEVISDTDEEDVELLEMSDGPNISEGGVRAFGNANVITIEDEENLFDDDTPNSSYTNSIPHSQGTSVRNAMLPAAGLYSVNSSQGLTPSSVGANSARGLSYVDLHNPVGAITSTSAFSGRNNAARYVYHTRETIDDIIEESVNKLSECPGGSSSYRKHEISTPSNLDEFAFNPQNLLSQNSEGMIGSANIVGDTNREHSDGLFEEKPKRHMSFVYRYRTMMEQEARNRGGIHDVVNGRIQGSSVRYLV
ncbi:hypothetical protein X943_001917 [Babesia divergens]|uniref:Uncharacterized protein n=1 Tax=Babesia divergens TaxID=32595 RepID=A0AAD9GJK7_BABDI|nr:hypothetical protein X943_001917 [Babesia divergens]